MAFDGDNGSKRRGVLLPLLLAVSAVALTGCVSAGDPAFTSAQSLSAGTVPASSQFALADPSVPAGASADPAVALASATASDVNPATAATPGVAPTMVSMAAPAQTDAASVDALNRGITQTGELRPVNNLFATGAADAAGSAPAMVPVPTPSPLAPLAQAASPAAAAPTEVADLAPQAAAVAVPVPVANPANPQAEASAQVIVTAVEPAAESAPTALVEPPKKGSIFARLFNAQPTPPKAVPSAKKPRTISPRQAQEVVTASSGGTGGLPGVRLSTLFEIKTGTEEDGEDAAGVEIASAAGLARLSPNGLHTQTDKVEVSCFKPRLIQVLRNVERHYGRDVVITSGYRSPKFNRRVGGASHSRHTTCEAADIQVAGVSKWELARYLRSMPGRGGIGTYCHTESVHVDVGSERDWNWRCRRRK